MKLFKTFREFRVFDFRYRATNENAELEENKIRAIFDWENMWRGIRVSLGIILRLFYQQRKEIMIFRGIRWFREFRGIDLAHNYEVTSLKNIHPITFSKCTEQPIKVLLKKKQHVFLITCENVTFFKAFVRFYEVFMVKRLQTF